MGIYVYANVFKRVSIHNFKTNMASGLTFKVPFLKFNKINKLNTFNKFNSFERVQQVEQTQTDLRRS